MKKIIFILAVLTAYIPHLQAQKVATTSMQFLKVMPAARGTAMGDAYSVLASGADAVFWNPAGITLSDKQELSTTFISWMMDAKLGAISYSRPVEGIGYFGASIQYVDYGEFEETIWGRPYIGFEPNPGMTGRKFRPYAMVAAICYAAQLTDKFSTGLSIKYAYESLFNGSSVRAMVSQNVYENVDTWGSGILFDFGMRYKTGYKTLEVAVAIQNFGADITYAKEANAAPLQFRWGIAGDIIGVNSLLIEDDINRFGFAFDLFQPNDYEQQEHLGFEYEYAHILALRAGYKFNYDSEGLTLGTGFKYQLSSIPFSFDYSYGTMNNYLGDVHRISLGVSL